MPTTAIVDAHVHLWDPQRLTYGWLDEVPAFQRPFLPTDYQVACGSHVVERMVFVQCEAETSQNLAEAKWVTELAVRDPRIQGIVAFAPLEQGPAVREELSRLVALPLVKGIRRLIQSETDPAFCSSPPFVAGVQMLADFDRSFDLCIKHSQLASTIQLVRRCPNVRFVLDHLGKPDIRGGHLDPWRKELQELAESPNVWCKISGMITEADTEHWQASDLRPYLQHAIDCFGFDRLMFGGDWPVVNLGSTLSRWIDVLAEEVAGYSETEQGKLFSDNCMSFYRLIV